MAVLIEPLHRNLSGDLVITTSENGAVVHFPGKKRCLSVESSGTFDHYFTCRSKL